MSIESKSTDLDLSTSDPRYTSEGEYIETPIPDPNPYGLRPSIIAPWTPSLPPRWYLDIPSYLSLTSPGPDWLPVMVYLPRDECWGNKMESMVTTLPFPHTETDLRFRVWIPPEVAKVVGSREALQKTLTHLRVVSDYCAFTFAYDYHPPSDLIKPYLRLDQERNRDRLRYLIQSRFGWEEAGLEEPKECKRDQIYHLEDKSGGGQLIHPSWIENLKEKTGQVLLLDEGLKIPLKQPQKGDYQRWRVENEEVDQERVEQVLLRLTGRWKTPWDRHNLYYPLRYPRPMIVHWLSQGPWKKVDKE